MMFTLSIDMENPEAVTASDIVAALRNVADEISYARHIENSPFPDDWGIHADRVILNGVKVGTWAFKQEVPA